MPRTVKKISKQKKEKPAINSKISIRKEKANSGKYRSYSSEAVECAIKAAKSGTSMRKASKTFGVPVTTIYRKMRDPNSINCRIGPPTILSEKEEDEIAQWIIYRSERGSPVTKDELFDSVQSYVKSLKKVTPFIDGRPSRHWYEGFCRRHPNLNIRTLHWKQEDTPVSVEELKVWYNEIENYLSSKGLLEIHPSRVFNCKAMNVLLRPKHGKVLAENALVYNIVEINGKDSIPTMFMYSADGTRAPPLILYCYKRTLPKKIIENCPGEWGLGISEKEWMTKETFYEYFGNVFYNWLVKKNIEFPVIVYVEHSSYVSVPLISFCKEKNIELISLYPRVTHLMQPLDVAFLNPFKDIWNKIIPKWKSDNNTDQLKKDQFPVALEMALNSLEERNIIQDGFKKCGLMPFDANAFEFNVLNKEKKSDKNSTLNDEQENEVPFMNKSLFVNYTNKGKQWFLESFEKTLSSKLLLDFKNSDANGFWTGNLSERGLYDYWINIKKAANGTTLKNYKNFIFTK